MKLKGDMMEIKTSDEIFEIVSDAVEASEALAINEKEYDYRMEKRWISQESLITDLQSMKKGKQINVDWDSVIHVILERIQRDNTHSKVD